MVVVITFTQEDTVVAKPDEVKQLATQAVTAGVMRVIATVVDPQTAAKKLVDDVRELPTKAVGKAVELPLKAIGQLMELQAQVAELPKVASGLPLKLALQAITTGEKVRNLLPGHGTATATASEATADRATATQAPAAPDDPSSGAAAWDAAAPKPDPLAYTPPVAGGHTAQAAKVKRTELKAVPDVPPTKAPAAKAAPSPATSPAANPAAKTPATSDAAKTPAKKAPAKRAAGKAIAKAVPDAPVSAATHDVLAALADTLTDAAPSAEGARESSSGSTQESVATVTPIHAGRDGHVDAPLPATVEAAVDAAPAGAGLTADELPLAGYGSLSITQIRSRISKLDAVQLTQLRDYERAHADRTPIVTLLETKLAKVTGASATTVDTASTVSSSAPGETAALIAEAPSKN